MRDDADWISGILAVAGAKCGGVVLKEAVAPSFLAAMNTSFKSLPPSISSELFTGTLDLAATLALGKPVRAEGLLQSAATQRLLIRRADALDSACVSHLSTMLDDEKLELVAVIEPDNTLAERIADRLAFGLENVVTKCWRAEDFTEAQKRFVGVELSEEALLDLCQAALALSITSPRSVLHAVHSARAVAALRGLDMVDDDAVTLAARLVFAHRATRLPETEEERPQQNPENKVSEQTPSPEASNAEVILESVKAAIPAHILQALASNLGRRGSARHVKSKQPAKAKSARGRRMGSRKAQSLAGKRLDVIATLRNAAPWQTLRRRATATSRMIVTRDDFQIHRIKQRNEATAIFAVDASGSTAFQRLAEAKGAVEAILAECYVRRDRVALVSFRSKAAEELLPPTRSLERARRALSALPGGGGTPLASGLDKVFQISDQVRRAGATPIVIILTDGRANVARSGEGNKMKALEESEQAARAFAAEGIQAMVIDVATEPQRHARELANHMAATYFAMPRAGALDIAKPVTAALRNRA